MKDWKEWFKVFISFDGTQYSESWGDTSDSNVNSEDIYQAFLARMIDEGYIEANPKRWVRPVRDDVLDYFMIKKVDYSHLEGNKFYDYWDSLDWMARKTRIKSWKGRANTWIKNNEKFKRNDSSRFNGESAADKTAASIANRNR